MQNAGNVKRVMSMEVHFTLHLFEILQDGRASLCPFLFQNRLSIFLWGLFSSIVLCLPHTLKSDACVH